MTAQTDRALLAAALWYASQGIAVFPLSPGTKKPLSGSRGFLDATTDARKILAWWNRTPDANIGIATGASGLLVLDLDTYKESFAGELPTDLTPRVRTARGGVHVYYRRAPGQEWPSSAKGLDYAAVDIRSKTGYLVAPPSHLSDGDLVGDYTWELSPRRLPFAPVPPALAAALDNANTPKPPAPQPGHWAPPAGTDDADYSLIESAVHALHPRRAEGYQEWRDVGFALKAWGQAGALELFHWFSQHSPKYDARQVDKAWAGFRGSGITVASLIAWAIEDSGADALRWPERDNTPNPTADPAVVQRYTQLCNLAAWANTPACLVTLRTALEDAGLSPRGAYSAHKVWQRLTHLARANVAYTLRKDVSTRRIAEHTAMSHVSVHTALTRLQTCGWLLVTTGEAGELTVTLSVSLTPPPILSGVKDTDFLAASLPDDIFAVAPALKFALARRVAPCVLLPSLGPGARYIVAALTTGALSMRELIEASGLTRSATYTAVNKLRALELLEEDGRKIALVGDFAGAIDALRTQTRTFGNTQRRLELHSRERSAHVQRLLAQAQQAKDTDAKRVLRLQAARDRYEGEAAKIRDWLQVAGLKPASGPHWGQMRYDRQRARDRADSRPQLAQLAKELKGMPVYEATRLAEIAGYTRWEALQALGR